MIKHLQGLEINSIYDFDNTFSINELLCKFWEKIEETINISNESIDILNWIKEQGLPGEVQVLLNQLVADGTIEQMINVGKIEELRTLINTKYAEMLTNHNNEVLTLTNKVDNTETSLNELENRVTNIETDINDVIQTELNDIDGRITNLSNNIPQTYQPLNSNSLNTKSKSVVGAINELNNKTATEAKNTGDGYRKFNDGLIIQWGAGLIQTADYIGETSIIFPVPFGSVYNVIVGMEGATSWMSVSVKERNNSGFKIEGKCHKGANDEKYGIGAVRVNWIAIGGAN